ncbi:MAG: hypothetical protein Phog2KO_31360 [Phototrophicaceae bacterium]
MATGSLQVNRDIILATRRQHLKQQMKSTPLDAVLALAQMQNRPRSILNYSNNKREISLFAQVTRHEIYDPVTSALHCLVNGADGIAFFTDHSIYHHDLDDLLIVARAMPTTPVIYQNYMLGEYDVMAARASDASALMFYSNLIDQQALRQVVSMAQRWKMMTIVQVSHEDDLEYALTLSPHAIAFGDNLSKNISASVDNLMAVQNSLPHYSKIFLTHALHTIEDVILALTVNVDALIVDESLLKNERTASAIRELINDAEKRRAIK